MPPEALCASNEALQSQIGYELGRMLNYDDLPPDNLDTQGDPKPHRLHVYYSRHNTHITLVQPPRTALETPSSGVDIHAKTKEQDKIVDVLLSLSCGQLGFRKAARGSYDAAYQLTALAMKQIEEKKISREISSLEVIYRGFGKGRDGVTKALLGMEGKFIRDRIISVQDATRLKIGGARSPKPRRR